MPVDLTEVGTPEQNANFQQALQELLALGRKYRKEPPVAESGTPEQNVNFATAMAEAQALAAKYKVDIGKYAARPSQSSEQAQRKAALLAETAALRSQPDPTWLTGYRQANAEVSGDVARGVAQVPVGMLKFAGTVADTARRWFPDASQVGETGVGGPQSALTRLGEFIESQANRLPGGDPEALSGQFNRGIGQLGGMLTPAAVTQAAVRRLATGAALKAGAASEAAVLAGAKAGRSYGTATAVTAGFGQEFDDAFQRSRRLGDDPDTALFKALGYGTVAAGIEQFAGAGRLFRKFFPSPDEAIKALTTWNVSKEIVKNFVAGYAEEAAQKIAQNAIVEPGSDLLAGAHEEGRVGGLVQGLVGLPSAARGMRPSSSQPPPLPAQTERLREANEPAPIELPTTPAQPSVAPADLLGRTFPYNEQGAIARIVGATSQGVEIETPEGKVNVSFEQWKTTPQDVFERTKTQTELPYVAAIAKPATVKIIAPKLSTPPAVTAPSRPAAEPVTAAASIAGVQPATPSQESGQIKPGLTAAQTPVAGGAVPIGSFVAKGKDSTGTWKDETVTVLSVGEPIKQRRASSDGGWQVSFEVPSTLGKTGRQTRTRNFFKKANALAWIAGVRQSKPSQTISNAPTERTPDEVLTKTNVVAPIAGVPPVPPVAAAEVKAEAPKGAKAVAQRIVNAEESFISFAMENAGLTREQALTALVRYKKDKAIKIDPVGGRFTFTNGEFANPEVIRRAATLESPKVSKPKTARTERAAIKQRLADAQEFQRLMIEYGVQEGWIKRPDLLNVRDQDSSHQPGTALLKAKFLHSKDIISARKSAVSDLGGSVEETTREDVAALLPKLKAYIEAKYGGPAKQKAAFEKATASGPVATDAERLSVGDTLNIEGELLKVTARDNETGDITLEDGTRFGVQTLSEGETIYVERVDEPTPQPVKAPKLASGQNQGDLISSTQTEDFALVGEKGTDLERLAAAKSKAQSDAAEAKRIQDGAQGLLPEIAFSQVDPPFYSRITRAIEQSSQGKASGAQWKAAIRNSKLGVNADEFALVGVNDLEDGKVYTKAEVLDYLKANEVVVKDVTLGGKPVQLVTEAWGLASEAFERLNRLGFDRLNDAANAVRVHEDWQSRWNVPAGPDADAIATWRDVVRGSTQQPYFSTYQLPGANEGSYREVLLTQKNSAPMARNMDEALELWKADARTGIRGTLSKDQIEATKADDVSDTLKEEYMAGGRGRVTHKDWKDGHSQYGSIKNPIVRLRFNERTTADGKRMLFLEEVQAPRKGEFEKMPALFQKNWREIAFKWALRHAAENGFDSVGWATGAQQAERYSLAKQLDSVKVVDAGAKGRRGFDVTGYKGKKAVVVKANVPLEDLESVIGKDLAGKVVTDHGNHPLGLGDFSKTYSGLDLEIGGEGLKKLYDVDFRNVVNNLPAVKKSGQKVGSAELITGKGGKKIPDGAGGLVETGAGRELINSLELTPVIRESVMGGQAMFSQRAAPSESGLTVEGAQESMRPMLAGFPESSRPQIVVAPARDWPADTQALIPEGRTVNGATHRRTVNGKTVTTIYIDPEQIGSDEELRQVLAEELVGHSGMAALLSESEIDRLYALLNRSRPERVAELSKDVSVSGDTITGRRAIVDEFLGESARTLPRSDPLWRQLFDAIVNALRRLNLLPASLDESKLDAWVRQLGRQANRRLRSGRYNVDGKVILPDIAFSSKPNKIVTVMHGVPQEIGGVKTADFNRLSALELAERLIGNAGLATVRRMDTDGVLVLVDEGPPSTTQQALRIDKSAQQLIEMTKQGFFRNKESELRPPSDEDATGDQSQEPNIRVALGQFMDTMAFMGLRMRNEYDAGRNAAFSEDRVKELLEYAQGWRSEVGRTLQMMNQRLPRGVLKRGKYMDVELKSAMQEELDPQGIITKVLREIRVRFGNLLGADPITGANPTQVDIETLNTLTGFLDATFARTAQRMTSKLYRMVQSALQPQVAKTLSALEAEAVVQEAFRQIIANAKLVGITEQEKKTKPLTAMFKLLKFAKPESVAGIDAAIDAAVRTGERQAGREIFAETASDEDLALYDEGLIQPTSEQVEEGLLLPRHKHWKAIRDSLLGYSPVTDQLVTQVLRGDFKGIRGKPGAPKPTVPKIDLATLAKEPDAEVQRVFDEYAKNIQDMLDLTGATPWMQTRIAMQIREQLTEQLAGQREVIRNRFFAPKKERAEADTPSERFQALVNAGLLTDERILNGLLAEAATKSSVTKLLPTMKSLIAQVFSTPAFKRDELADRFVGLLVDQFQIDAAQQAEARKLFKTAFERKMKEAKDKALDLVYAALPDNEKDQIPKGRANWKTLTSIVNAGFFDDLSVYREIARKNGWRYNDEDIAEVKRLAEQAQRLLELSDAEKAAAGGDPVKLARAALDRASTFNGAIKGLEKRMHTLWARLIKPIRSLKPYGPTEKIKGRFDPRRIRLLQEANIRANNVKAYYEHIVGNILFSLNFGVRQAIDIGTSSTIYTPTRAWGQTKERFDLIKARAVRDGVTEPMRLEMVGLFGEALGEAFSVRIATIGSGWNAMKEAWKGRNLPSQVEGFDQSVKLFDRVNLKIKELRATKDPVNHAQAVALSIFAWEGLSLRFAGSLDMFQATPKAWQEFRHLITTEMIRLGMSKAERIINEEKIMGDIAGEYKAALAQAEILFAETDIKAPKSQIKTAAWAIILGRAYERASGIGLNVDDADGIKARIKELTGYTSWNLPEGGIGGLVFRVPAKAIQEALEKTIVKLPFIGWLSAPLVQGLGLFGNAMAMSANRGFVSIGGGSIPGSIGKLQSPGVHYTADRGQRQAESAILLPMGMLIAGAIIAGIFKWYGREPDDELERESRRSRGILPGTLGIPRDLSGNEFLIPLTVGPGFYVASWANFGGFLRSRMDKRIKEQAALEKEAAKSGLKAEQLPSLDSQDVVGAILLGLSTPFTGGRTASGKWNAFDFQLMLRDPGAALKRLAVSQVTPSVPLLPAYAKLMWAGGVRMDLRRARLDQLLVPLPWSGARQVNLLGDDVSNPDAIAHAVATVTGGFGIADKEVDRNLTAYTNLIVGGYHPPLNLNEGRNFNGAYRRFTDGEANHFAPTVGARFKANLTALGDISGMDAGARWQAAQGAYHAAERQTLREMGFTPNPERQTADGSARPKAAPVVNRPRAAALPRSNRSGSRAFSVRVPSYAPSKLKRGRRSRGSRKLFASVSRPRRIKLSRVRSGTKSRRRLFSV